MRAGWGGGSPPRAGLCAGGRTKQPLCVRWPSGCRASCWRLRATVLRPGGCRGAVCSPRFGCGQGRRPEGGRRRSSGQTGLGFARRLSRRRRRSGGLRKAAQVRVVRRAVNAVWPEAPTSSSVGLELERRAPGEARQRGRPQPLSASLPNKTEVEWAIALGGAREAGAEWQLSGRCVIGGRSGDAAASGDGQGEAGFCPSVQTDAPAANQKAAGAASCCCLLLSVVRPLGWMKAGWCVPVSGCLRRGLPWQGWITI